MRLHDHRDPNEARATIRQWVGLLAKERYDEAAEALFDSPVFDARTLRGTVDMYREAQSEPLTGVTDPEGMDLGDEPFEFWIFPNADTNGREASGAEYFIPFDGRWSMLAVEFEFVAHPEGGYAPRLSRMGVQ